jgi:hypothetical protein
MEIKICMTVNKVDVVILNFCKTFRLNFKMYISNNVSHVLIFILVDLVCFNIGSKVLEFRNSCRYLLCE